MSPVSMLCSLVRRAYPNEKAIASLSLDSNLRQAWRQLGAAAGVDPWTLAAAIAKQIGCESAQSVGTPDLFALQLVPERLASESLTVPLREENGLLVVASAAPFDDASLQRVQFVANRRLRVLVAPPDDIEIALINGYSRISEQQAGAIGTLFWSAEGDALSRNATDQNAIVRLARSLLMESIKARASDLHMQPFAGGGMLRIRVDGVLQRLAFIPGLVLQALVRYFKAQGGMDPTNDLAPQDGRLSLVLGNHDYDLRLSVLPASRGERLVLRFLDQSRNYKLSGGGFSTAALQAMRRLAANSSGVVLLTGPTGSGKTSTLYSMLSEINRVGVSILTVENPVEYRVSGISQVEVNPKAGLTFATALRSILRQDPDVILIGEIRDGETADIAMQAALTGHLVLSTLHTNDALTAIPRLIDLGVHPSIVADALTGVVSQRLVRKLCTACRVKVEEPLRPDERLFLDMVGERPTFRAAGCPACKGTGYLGRQPVTEIVEITPELRQQLRATHGDIGKLRDLAQSPLSCLSHGVAQRVISGDTTALEATRIMGQRFWSDLAREFNRPLAAGTVTALAEGENTGTGIGILLFSIHAGERAALAHSLGTLGLTIHAVDDPEQARDVLEKNENIVLLIADVDTGNARNNISTLVKLRRALAWSRLPVLVMAPQQDVTVRQILEEHGVADYLIKPATTQAVVERVQAMLER